MARRANHAATLHALGLPRNLLTLIQRGELEEAVTRAQAELGALRALLDAWELSNPEAAKLTPWFESREAWKAAGRPQPDWWDALRWSTEIRHGKPMDAREISERLTNSNSAKHEAKLRAKGLMRGQKLGDAPRPVKKFGNHAGYKRWHPSG